MLSRFRRLVRPLAFLALIVFIAPGLALECREISAIIGTAMSCCQQDASSGAGMKAGCCAVQSPNGGSDRAPITGASARSTLDVASVLASALQFPAIAPPALARAADLDSTLPAERLYLRLSSIRR